MRIAPIFPYIARKKNAYHFVRFTLIRETILNIFFRGDPMAYIPEEHKKYKLLLNALIHRDYMNTAPIQIQIFKDKIDIWNIGKMPDDMKLATKYGVDGTTSADAQRLHKYCFPPF